MNKWIPDRKVLVAGPIYIVTWFILQFMETAGVAMGGEAELIVSGIIAWIAQYFVPAHVMDAARHRLPQRGAGKGRWQQCLSRCATPGRRR